MSRPTTFDDVMREIVQLRKQVRALSSPQLAHSSFDSGAGHSIDEVDPETGQTVAAYGTQYDGSHGAVPYTGPIPPVPTAPILEAAPAVLTGGWDGEFEGGPLVVPTMDWSHAEVHASQTLGFTAEFADTIIGTINTPRGGKVTAVVEPGTWYVRLVSRSIAGKRSAASPAVTIVVPATVDTSQIEADLAEAEAAILNAAEDAQEAFDLADEASRKITISVNVPSGTGVPGALWFRKDGTGAFIGQWEWVPGSPGSWAVRTTDGGIITNLAVTNLVAGSGTMTQAVIDKLYTDVVVSRKMVASNVLIGEGGNEIPNGTGEKGATGGFAPATGIVLDTTDKPASFAGAWKNTVTTGSNSVQGSTDGFFVTEPGAEYIVEVWAKANKANSRLVIELRDQAGVLATTNVAVPGGTAANGTVSSSYPFYQTLTTTWTKYEVLATVKAGVTKMRIGAMYFNHSSGSEQTATQSFTLRARLRTAGSLIAENSITAPKIVASEELSAKVASFLEVTAGMVNTNDLWADTAWIAAARTHILTVLSNTNGSGYTSTVTGQGLKVTRTVGADTYDVIRLGTFGADYISVSDGAGNALAAMSGTGDIGAQSAYAQGDVFSNGMRLGDAVNDGPRGEVTYGEHRFVPGNTPSSWSSTAFLFDGPGSALCEISFTAVRGRAYRLFGNLKWFVTVAGPERISVQNWYKIGGTSPTFTTYDGKVGPPPRGMESDDETRLNWAQTTEFGGRFIPFPYNSTVSSGQTIECKLMTSVGRQLSNGVINVEYVDVSVVDLGTPATYRSHLGMTNGTGSSTLPAVTTVTTTYTSAQLDTIRARRVVGGSGVWTKYSADGLGGSILQGINSGGTFHYKSFVVPPAAFYTELAQTNLLNIESIKVTIAPKAFKEGMGTVVLGLANKTIADAATWSDAPNSAGFYPDADVVLGAWPSQASRTIELPRAAIDILRTSPNKVFSIGANIPDGSLSDLRYSTLIEEAAFTVAVKYRKTV